MGTVVAERQVLDRELLLMEDIYFHMGWTAWGQISQQCPALDSRGPLLGQKAEHLQSVRKVVFDPSSEKEWAKPTLVLTHFTLTGCPRSVFSPMFVLQG